MIRHLVPELRLNSFLRNLDNWALLRNADIYENFSRGGDCDLIVSDFEHAEQELTRQLGVPVRVAKRSYVRSFHYEWGHIDMTDGIYWRGIELCAGSVILSRSIKEGLIFPQISHEDEAITLLLNSLLWGGFIKKRYCARILTVFSRDGNQVLSYLSEMVGTTCATKIFNHVRDEDWHSIEKECNNLRRMTFVYHMIRSPFRSIIGYVRFLSAELRVRFKESVPVLHVNIDGEAGINIFTEFISVHGGQLEYKVKVVRFAGSSVMTHLRLLKYCSFRARNGLLVVIREGLVVPGNVSGPVFRVDCNQDIERQSAEILRGFQRFCRVMTATRYAATCK
jgi:hypothetical protein